MILFLKILFFIITMLAAVGEVKSSTVANILWQEAPNSRHLGGGRVAGNDRVNAFVSTASMALPSAAVSGASKVAPVTKVAAKPITNVLSKGEVLRIQNAATRLNKPISVVGSRATGKAGPYSDWDYIIEGGLKNSREWSTIKNSLPGARSVLDNTPRMIDIHQGPIWPGYPYITIYPR